MSNFDLKRGFLKRLLTSGALVCLAFVSLTRSCSKGTSLRKHPFPSGEVRGETDVFAGYKGTQRQFSENICSEDDLRSRIFGTFAVKFLACLPPLGFSNILKMA